MGNVGETSKDGHSRHKVEYSPGILLNEYRMENGIPRRVPEDRSREERPRSLAIICLVGMAVTVVVAVVVAMAVTMAVTMAMINMLIAEAIAAAVVVLDGRRIRG